MADRKVLDPVDARQGTRQKMNYRVLTRSLLVAAALAALAFVVFYIQSSA